MSSVANKTKENKYKGITEKKMKNGTIAIMVRFKYDNTIYPVKNFTKLYGCKTRSEAKTQLDKIKVGISQGIKPFVDTPFTLNDIWAKRLETKRISKEWTLETRTNYNYFYNKHIKKWIGHKKLNKITYENLKEIVDNMPTIQGGSKNRVQKLMYPIFDDAIKNGTLNNNPAKHLKIYKSGSDKNIKLRVKNKNLFIARELVKAIPKYQVHQKSQEQEIKMYLYMVVFTAHRIGELLRLKKENVIMDELKIISPPEITKTKIEYHFPIPPICLDYIKSIPEGLLFPTLKKGGLYNIFQRLLKLTDIQFYEGKTISPHDMRRIMLNIMVIDCNVDGMLADSCLSHQQKGSTKHYVGFEDEHIREAYEKYWDKITLEDKDYDAKYNQSKIIRVSNEISNTDKLLKLFEMYQLGLLTEEEFKVKKEELT